MSYSFSGSSTGPSRPNFDYDFFSPLTELTYFENLGCIKLLKENCIHQLYQNYINSNVILVFDAAGTSS